MRALLSKGLGFGVPVLLSGFVQLAVIPVVIAVAGPQVWGQLAIAQAAGAMAAVVVAYGWNLIGPATVAGMPAEQRGEYYFNSLVSRLLLFVLAGLAYWIAVWLILGNTPDFLALALGGFSLVVGALGGVWFFTGEGSPKRLVLAVTAPITLFTLLGAGLYLWVENLLVFTAVQFLGYTLSVVFSALSIARRYPTVIDFNLGRAAARLKESFSAVVTAVTATLYVNAPILIVNLLVPAAVPAYALIDRVLKFSLTVMSPLTQLAQSYVPAAPDNREFQRRVKQSLTGVAVVAVAASLTFLALAQFVTGILSNQSITVSWELVAPFALSLGLIIFSSITGLAILAALNRFRVVAEATVIGAGTGLILTFVLGSYLGVTGIAWAVAVAEAVVLGYHFFRLRMIPLVVNQGGTRENN